MKQSPNRNRFTLAGHLAKLCQTHPEFDAQQFTDYAKKQKGVIKQNVDRDARIMLLGFKAAGVIEKAGYRQGANHPMPITVWRVKTQ